MSDLDLFNPDISIIEFLTISLDYFFNESLHFELFNMVSAIKFRLMPPQAYVVIIGSPVYKAVLKAMELLGGGVSLVEAGTGL